MLGFPRVLNTKADYLLILQKAKMGELSQDMVKRSFQSLLNTQKSYVFDRVLGASEDPDGIEPDCRVVAVAEGDTTERHQFLLSNDANGIITKIGFTEQEIKQIIAELEV